MGVMEQQFEAIISYWIFSVNSSFYPAYFRNGTLLVVNSERHFYLIIWSNRFAYWNVFISLISTFMTLEFSNLFLREIFLRSIIFVQFFNMNFIGLWKKKHLPSVGQTRNYLEGTGSLYVLHKQHWRIWVENRTAKHMVFVSVLSVLGK